MSTFTGGGGCSDSGYYAVVTEVIYGRGVFDNVVSIAVADSDVDLDVDETQTLVIYAIYSDGTAPTIVENSLLTFTSSDDSVATVDTDGKITAHTAGTAQIEIVATESTELSAYAVVTVSAIPEP